MQARTNGDARERRTENSPDIGDILAMIVNSCYWRNEAGSAG
jgi:hypothetical protein